MPAPPAPPALDRGSHAPAPTPTCAPPFDPVSFAALLRERPTAAAAVLARMLPAQRAAQAQAHAAHTHAPPSAVERAWALLVAALAPRAAPADSPRCVSVYDPEQLADVLHDDPPRARALLAQLSEPQRTAQAVAYAAWLNTFNYPVAVDEVLAWWAALCAPVPS